MWPGFPAVWWDAVYAEATVRARWWRRTAPGR